MKLMMHAPIWWYVWLGVVLLFGVVSLLKLSGGRPSSRPERSVPGRLATPNADWAGKLEFPDGDEHAGRDQQGMAAALDEADRVGRYATALASHDPSFSPGAPVSPFDPGGSAHLGG